MADAVECGDGVVVRLRRYCCWRSCCCGTSCLWCVRRVWCGGGVVRSVAHFPKRKTASSVKGRSRLTDYATPRPFACPIHMLATPPALFLTHSHPVLLPSHKHTGQKASKQTPRARRPTTGCLATPAASTLVPAPTHTSRPQLCLQPPSTSCLPQPAQPRSWRR